MPSLSPGLLAITGIRVEMPRRYQRKTNRGSWSQENLTLSKEAIASGVSIKQGGKLETRTKKDPIYGGAESGDHAAPT
ncbi:uncharacterized protein LOC129776605 isoform X2 [Toxorhynchites rutilus septentrionalis]|uniref:uncharacterized protein LOC129776605 isoform X2 n=1 Tax=Toxorhynchites rutilus septentrionalis TaxID=329112 RepID=UPI002479E49C|nr:uncharacterized protein LOC129776605 isoform X2 [Toxorhynchites rutilus septentrionalis]